MHLVWKSIILIVKSLLATNVHCASMVKTSKESIRLRVDGGCSSLRVNLFTLKRRQHSAPDQTDFSCPQAAGSPTPDKWEKTWLKNLDLSSILPRKPLGSCDCRLPKVACWGEQVVLVGCFHLHIFKVFDTKHHKTLIFTGPGSRLPSLLAHWNWPVLWKSLLTGRLEQIQPVEVIEWWM